MKVCSVCSNIISVGEGCNRSDCPHPLGEAPHQDANIEPEFTGKADRVIQENLFRPSDLARGRTGKAAFAGIAALILFFALALALFNARNGVGASEQIEVTVISAANVRNAPSTESSMILETLPPGTELEGQWVNDSAGSEDMWLELESGSGFVWSGNLQERLTSPPGASKEYHGDPSKIPDKYWGRWTEDPSRCATRYDDSMVEIYGDSVRFWESEGEVTNVKWDGAKISVALSMFGEGEQWESEIEIQKTSSQNQIRINDYLYFKCR